MKKPTKNKRVLARRSALMKHAAWSTAVRTRDGFVCQLCGAVEYIQAHHWYAGKRACPELAHDTDNGCSLCLRCHKVLAHKQGTYRVHAAIRAAMVKAIGYTRVNALIKKAGELCTNIVIEK